MKKKKDNKMRIKKGLSCILVGSVFLGFCYFMIKMDENRMTNLDSSTNSIKTTYTTKKSKDSIMYTPHFTYIVNGQKYVCTSNFSSSIKPSTKPRKIFYNSQDPQDCYPQKETLENTFFYVFLIFPILFIIVGFASIFGLIPEQTEQYPQMGTKNRLKDEEYYNQK